MVITKNEIRKMIREALTKKVKSLKEGSDFTAKRYIVHSAQNASMEFEKEIAKILNLINVDELQPELQKRYFEIAETMKGEIVKAVTNAIARFAQLPRNKQE